MEDSTKLYSTKAIFVATYFGGPVAAGYLIKKNYDAFNQKDNGIKALIIGIISTILLFVLGALIPPKIMSMIPNILLPLIYTLIINLLVIKFQGRRLNKHKVSGGEFYSRWRALGIGLIFMIIILGFCASILYINGDFSKATFSQMMYEKEYTSFSDNENKALAIFEKLENEDRQYLVDEFTISIDLWNQNKEILNQLNSKQNLNTELVEHNKILMKYCNLRIEECKLYILAINDSTEKFIADIKQKQLEIDEIINQTKN